MSLVPTTQNWWRTAERPVGHAWTSEIDGDPSWSLALRRAHDAELAGDADAALLELTRVQDLPESFALVKALLICRADLRRARLEDFDQLLTRLNELVELTHDDPASRARVLHSLGVLYIRKFELEPALAALCAALTSLEGEVAEAWVLESLGQALVGVGAWQSARRALSGSLERKRLFADELGIAITTGTLGRLELQSGNADAAMQLVSQLPLSGRVPGVTWLRLRTLALEAALEGGHEVETHLAALLESLGNAPAHALAGYAHVAVARGLSALGSSSEAREHIQLATRHLKVPSGRAIVGFWEEKLLGPVRTDETWLVSWQQLFAEVGQPTEAEIRVWLLAAERAAERGEHMRCLEHLDQALNRAIATNNSTWVQLVEKTGAALDPAGVADRTARRFTGRRLDELTRTRRTEATILFSDLVGFTERSTQLPAEEVMAASREVFELAAFPMRRHRVHPLAYLGDGLLAIAEGPGHETRALDCALDLVRRGQQATALHRAVNPPFHMQVRVGVCAGPVVLGVLGTAFKTEYTAIGLTVNLAARLQSQAGPGEVMASASVAEKHASRGNAEALSLKGVAESFRAYRFNAPPSRFA